MATITSFDGIAFGPETTHAMSRAFDDVCETLGLGDTNKREREFIAVEIIALARGGEHDAIRLRDHMLEEIRLLSAATSSVQRWRALR